MAVISNKARENQRSGSPRLFLTLMIVLCLVLAACSSPPGHDDLVGNWQYQGDNGRVAELELKADGMLVVDGVPKQLLIPSGEVSSGVDWSETVDGSGTWEIDSDGSLSLDVELHGGSFIFSRLYPAWNDQQSVIEAQINASDVDDVVFHKQL